MSVTRFTCFAPSLGRQCESLPQLHPVNYTGDVRLSLRRVGADRIYLPGKNLVCKFQEAINRGSVASSHFKERNAARADYVG
jgi:hypothetical protein